METLVINPFESGFIPWLKTSGVLTLPLCFDRLQNYAAQAQKTMTQVMEELIDMLPNIKNGDSS